MGGGRMSFEGEGKGMNWCLLARDSKQLGTWPSQKTFIGTQHVQATTATSRSSGISVCRWILEGLALPRNRFFFYKAISE